MNYTLRTWALVFVSVLLGAIASTLVTGCNPPAPRGPRAVAGGGNETTPDAEDGDTVSDADASADGDDQPSDGEATPGDNPEPGDTPEPGDEPEPGDSPEPGDKVDPFAKPGSGDDSKAGDEAGSGEASMTFAAIDAKELAKIVDKSAVAKPESGDWTQWAGTSYRNNVPNVGDAKFPTEWEIGGFDRETGRWNKEDSENILWVASLGSQTYGNPIVADGRVFLGTNNGSGYVARYTSDVDLGCLIAVDEKTGAFLWQHSNEKLPTGRVHDWPLQGICCAPYVEGNKLYYVSSRGHVVCLDTEGFYDGEDDGEVKNEWARQFKASPLKQAGLNDGDISLVLRKEMEAAGVKLEGYIDIEAEEDDKFWVVTIEPDTEGDEEPVKMIYEIAVDGQQLVVTSVNKGKRVELFKTGTRIDEGLADGKLSKAIRIHLEAAGVKLADKLESEMKKAGPNSDFTTKVDGEVREFRIRMEGPNLTAYLKTTTSDKHEADVIWTFDMMKTLGVSQHNMCSCSVTVLGDVLFVNTSNGVDESHVLIPSPDAPSFMAMDKNTGEVLWTDKSPGRNILHGQWSSPTIGTIHGVPQVIFAGGDGWVYSFKADKGKDGNPELLWKFDTNPKTSKWELRGISKRNNIIATPVIHEGLVYVAVGQDPEHGEGEGRLWCINPNKKGDVSPHLAVKVSDRSQTIPHRRLQAVKAEEGEMAIDNPNSAVVWHYSHFDQDDNDKIDFEELMHRSCGTVAIKDDLLYISDFSGLVHCLDAKTGKLHFTYDMLAQAWGSPLIAGGHVYIGDEDGDVAIFKLGADEKEPITEINMDNSVYSTPIIANGVLYIANKSHLFAIKEGAEPIDPADIKEPEPKKPEPKKPEPKKPEPKKPEPKKPEPKKPEPKKPEPKKPEPKKPEPKKPEPKKDDAPSNEDAEKELFSDE